MADTTITLYVTRDGRETVYAGYPDTRTWRHVADLEAMRLLSEDGEAARVAVEPVQASGNRTYR
jgi:hypothetical protein